MTVFPEILANLRKSSVYAVSPLVCLPLSQLLCVTPVGTQAFAMLCEMAVALMLVVVLFATPILITSLIFKGHRRDSLTLLLLASLFILCCYIGMFLSQKIRMAGMRSLAMRSNELVNAIKSYEVEHGFPPVTLDSLVPGYFRDIPSTGIMAYPSYRIITGEVVRSQYGPYEWVVSVPTPSAILNFDEMLYFPVEEYPTHLHGQRLERIGDWAYLHE